MHGRRALIRLGGAAVAGTLFAVSATGCAGAGEQPAPAPTSAPAADIAIGSDGGLPSSWPTALPTPAHADIVTVVVADDGATVNAVWRTDQAPDAAWDALRTALVAAGFRPSEAAGADQYVRTPEQITDTFVGDEYEVNVVVVVGDQTTIMLNASAT